MCCPGRALDSHKPVFKPQLWSFLHDLKQAALWLLVLVLLSIKWGTQCSTYRVLERLTKPIHNMPSMFSYWHRQRLNQHEFPSSSFAKVKEKISLFIQYKISMSMDIKLYQHCALKSRASQYLLCICTTLGSCDTARHSEVLGWDLWLGISNKLHSMKLMLPVPRTHFE